MTPSFFGHSLEEGSYWQNSEACSEEDSQACQDERPPLHDTGWEKIYI